MQRNTMTQIFKTLVVVGMGFYTVWFFMPFLWPYLYEPNVSELLYWNGYNAIIDVNHPVTYIIFAAYLVVTVGLYLFKSWARKAFVILAVSSLIATLLSGMSIQTGVEALLNQITTLTDGALFVILYFTSVASKFSGNESA